MHAPLSFSMDSKKIKEQLEQLIYAYPAFDTGILTDKELEVMQATFMKDNIPNSQAFNHLYNDIIIINNITSSLRNKFITVKFHFFITDKFITPYVLVFPSISFSKAVPRNEMQKELLKLLRKEEVSDKKENSIYGEERNGNSHERKGSNSKNELQILNNIDLSMIKLCCQDKNGLKSSNFAIENTNSCTENTEIDDNEVESDSGCTDLHKIVERTKCKIKPQRFDSHRTQFHVAEREKRRKSVEQWLVLELESDDDDDAIEAGDSDHVANTNRKRKHYICSKDRSAHETSHIDRLSDSTINSTPFLLVRRYNVAHHRH